MARFSSASRYRYPDGLRCTNRLFLISIFTTAKFSPVVLGSQSLSTMGFKVGSISCVQT